MISAGVWLATGEAYRPEAPGWFRITFAVSENDMRLGMKRYRLIESHPPSNTPKSDELSMKLVLS